MLEEATFRNFKALENVSVHLRPITAFIGPNASGKSSILDGIHLVSRIARPARDEWKHSHGRLGALLDREGGPERIRTFGSDGPVELAITRSPAESLRLLCSEERGDSDRWKYEVSYPDVKHSVECTPATNESRSFLASLPADLGAVARLRLDPAKHARPSYSEEEVPRIEHDGAGLASVLAEISANTPEVRERIEVALRRVVPAAGRVRTPRAKVSRREHLVEVQEGGESAVSRTVERTVWGHRLELQVGDHYVPGDQLSEGTLLALAVVTLLNGPDVAKVLLLDDLERGLHPRAQQALVELLKELVASQGGQLQCLVTTHSPYLLDALDDTEILALRLDEYGHSVCRPLTSHPDWSEWRGKMQMGEFWSTVGEDWVVGAAE